MTTKNTNGEAALPPTSCSARALSAAIRKAATLAKKHRDAIDAMAPLLMRRYGVMPNDVDCDSFIEATNYGHGGMTVQQLDAEMAARGYPPNTESCHLRGKKTQMEK